MYFYVSFIFSNCDYLLILMYLLPTLCKSIVKLSELTQCSLLATSSFLFHIIFCFHYRSMLIYCWFSKSTNLLFTPQLASVRRPPHRVPQSRLDLDCERCLILSFETRQNVSTRSEDGREGASGERRAAKPRETRAEPKRRKNKTAIGSLIWRFAVFYASLFAVINSSSLYFACFSM